MKYVIIKATLGKDNLATDYAFPFIFSSHIVHADAAKRFVHLVGFDSPFNNVEVLSAGSVAIHCEGAVCFPGSETLKIKSESEESENGLRDTRIMMFSESTGGVLL